MTKGRIWRKVLVGAGLVVGIIIVAGSIVLHQIIGLWPWEFLLSRLTSNQIEQKLPALKRKYPKVIKGNWEPSPFHMSKLLSQEADNLKRLGVNTVSVSVEHQIEKDHSYRVLDEQLVKSNIH